MPTATADITILSLHDALPILVVGRDQALCAVHGHHSMHYVIARAMVAEWDRANARAVGSTDARRDAHQRGDRGADRDRKSTRLNSSHMSISYAVFCLKKKTMN